MPKPDVALHPLVMMRTFSARLRARGRSLTGVLAGSLVEKCRRLRVARGPLTSETGDTLIEVLISALLVGLIVVGTLNGFSDVDRVSADQRNHNEATVLANESQEQLRSDPASTFDSSENNFEHTYTKAVNGTTFTIVQKASFLNEGGTNTACNATETKRQESNALRITSSVTWPLLSAAKRLPVVESSTVTPPTGSALEVDVGNYPTPTAGVLGVTTSIDYKPFETTSTDTEEGTTSTTGCFVFGALPTTSAVVEIGEKPGLVTVSGATKFPTKEVTIAPNYTTHYPVTLNEGGAIKAEFSYKENPEFEHPNNTEPLSKIKEEVTANTFVVYNQAMELTPFFEVGGTEVESVGGKSTVNTQPASGSSTYAHAIETPREAAKFTNGNLFPFPKPKAWTVYAGACPANNPNELNSSITDPTGFVESGKTITVGKIPMARMLLNVYTNKTTSANELAETTSYPVSITDTACKEITPDNESELNEPESTQKTTTSSTTQKYGGHLEHSFLPLGSGELCLAYNTGSGGSAKHYTYITSYELKAGEEYTRNILLGETSSYTESVKRVPSGATESVTIKVVKHSGSGNAECS
jgi:Tfp pilus assembly protein PilV